MGIFQPEAVAKVAVIGRSHLPMPSYTSADGASMEVEG